MQNINTGCCYIIFITIDHSNPILQETSAQKMASVSSNSSVNHHIRSISLPDRTHPMIQIVEEELSKLKSWVETSTSSCTTAGAICYGLSGLQELYESMDELLNLPVTVRAVSRHQQEKWIDDLLDRSVRLLDISGIAKDIVSQCKENVRDLQSSLRRGKMSGSKTQGTITKYFSSRREMRKDSKRSLDNFNQMIQETNPSAPTRVDIDHHVSTVTRLQLLMAIKKG